MDSFPIIFLLYTLRAIFCFMNFGIVFDYNFAFIKNKWKNSDLIWIIFYVFTTYWCRFMIELGQDANAVVVFLAYGLFFVRIIPFIWTQYGVKFKFIIMVLFYEGITEIFANPLLHIIDFGDVFGGNRLLKFDVFVTFVEGAIFLFLMILLAFRKIKLLNTCFTNLTTFEYVVLFAVYYVYGLVEDEILKSPDYPASLKNLSIIAHVLLSVLIIHTILIRKQNVSMTTIIGNLEEPMKQMAEYYGEMNEKNTELRRFRHDTKNLLLALSALISENKNEQALKYIEEIKDAYQSTTQKSFDTGNFIADALISFKDKTANEKHIALSFEGFIPAEKVDDVDLVILLSNLIDNAIEAASIVDGERKIEIKSILKKNLWVFTISNTCIQDVFVHNNRIATTKADKESHGFGLANIERVVERYDGSLKLECKDHKFIATTVVSLK
ncbi:sensor histidine kinase [Butyrivibrio sp. YAB3001]|uniref:sensor histidine kinase n=1 Tax=Butyrivibrio sp. YAB3001 TaxID=1520812 RepID=UPI0008F63D5A|nr:sensor histidine kinase [Butyrivibrio sp. YAB3001]SFC01930.1 GHKL domain-containing protein [Butyrivibrio sp. YAB3001]